MKQVELLRDGENKLQKQNIEDAQLKAKLLLEHILKQSRQEFIINSQNEVTSMQEQEYNEKLNEIIQGKPLQYITKKQSFMGLNFYVDENVLIPQPDTEILVEQAIKLIKNFECNVPKQNEESNDISGKSEYVNKRKINMLDLCTGSGAIAVSVAKYINDANYNALLEKQQLNVNANTKANITKTNIKENTKIHIIASDISIEALNISKKNAIENNTESEMEFIQSDMFYNLKDYKFDIIASNPPYIETNVIPTLSNEVKQEPKLALDGGVDGLKFYRIILKQAQEHLNENGYVLFEIGYNQAQKIIELWKELKEENECNLELITKEAIKDLGGNDRVMIFKYIRI